MERLPVTVAPRLRGGVLAVDVDGSRRPVVAFPWYVAPAPPAPEPMMITS
jgi:hypothetical protein